MSNGRVSSPCVRGFGTRITSYNVCYTKLLRAERVIERFGGHYGELVQHREEILKVLPRHERLTAAQQLLALGA